MWFATMDGLNRYDGTRFEHFRTNTQSDSLPSNLIRSLYFSKKNQLWVGTQRGLARYNPSKATFTRVRLTNDAHAPLIWGIFELEEQLIVSTEQSLYRYNAQQDNFETLVESPLSRSIKAVTPLNAQQWLLGSYDNGLNIYSHGRILHIPLLNDSVKSVFNIYKQGEQWLLATDKGVLQLEQSHVGNEPSFSAQLTHIAPPSLSTRELVFDGSEIWSVTEAGLYHYDTHNAAAEAKPVSTGLAHTKLYTSQYDASGNLWFGGNGGIYLNKRNNRIFKHIDLGNTDTRTTQVSINTIVPRNSQQIWLATDTNTLMAFDYVRQHVAFQMNTELEIRTLVVDSSQRLWIGAKSGLYYLNSRNQIEQAIGNLDIISLYDVDNALYIGTKQSGLMRYQLEQSKLAQVEADMPALPYITAFTHYKGMVVVGSDNGLFQLDTQRNRLTALPQFSAHYDHSSLYVNGLKTIGEQLYIATMGNGLIALSEQQHHIFDTGHGLPSDTVYGLEYAEGSLWISTGNGIARLSVDTNVLEYFTAKDGLAVSEYNTNSTTYLNDTVILGGINGLIVLTPSALKPPQLTKQLKFVSVSVNNLNVLQNKPNTVNAKPEIRLTDVDKRLSLEMAVPGVVTPSNIRYYYRLEGLDQSWMHTDATNPRAIYTNIPNGTYQLIAYAEDRFGRWKTPQQNIRISVKPPVWQSTTAFIAYMIVASAIFALMAKYRNRRRQQQRQVVESEERLKLSLWGSGDELWDWNITAGKIYRSNIWGKLEFPRDGRRNGDKQGSNIHPKDLPRVQKALTAHFNGDSAFYEASYRVKDKRGHWLWLLDRGKIVEKDEQGNPLRMTGTIKDISRLKKAEENLNLFARSVANISDAVFIMNKRFRIIEVNQAFCAITGYEKEQVLHHSLRFRNYPKTFTPSVKRTLNAMGRWVGELQDTRRNGNSFFLELAIDAIQDEAGEVSHYVGVFSDITERKQTENELRKLANTDTLTGLPNRSLFQANHNNLVSRNLRHALLVFDLDNFKVINDSLGHQAGDELLCALSKRVQQSCRKQDTIYRLGGDEFAILIDDTDDISTITSVAKHIQHLLVEPFTIMGQEHTVSASFGIVLFPLDGGTSEELLKNADTAMYHAKSQGSNRYVFFSDSMNKTAVRQLRIESIIRQAIRDDLFILNYQPKFDTQTGHMNGMEALVRLQHPSEGRVPPTEFIPAAEENSLIIEIGDIVLRKACFAAEAWRRKGLLPGRIAVNVSAKQFMLVNLPERIRQALTTTQLPANCLEIELTEGAFMAAPEKAISVMQEIQKMGVHIALDDFGTGYSSLAYLQRFPINTLKIDQTFVREMTKSASGENMIRSIISIARNLDLSIIAEGVETPRQKELLTQLQCETLQGYLLSRPLEEDAMTELMQQQRADGKLAASNKIA